MPGLILLSLTIGRLRVREGTPAFRGRLHLAVPRRANDANAHAHTLQAAWLKAVKSTKQKTERCDVRQPVRCLGLNLHPLTVGRWCGTPVAARVCTAGQARRLHPKNSQ